MSDLGEVVAAWRAAARRGEPAVVATVVRVSGSAYRRPGARMLFFPGEREPVGFVSGGCLEEDLAERAREVLASGEVLTLAYDMRSPDDIVWGLGLGCAGEVRVLLERIEPGGADAGLEFLDLRLSRREPGVLVSVFATEGTPGILVGDRLALPGERPATTSLASQSLRREAATALERGRSAVVSLDVPGGRVEALVEYVAPPIALVVYGAGRDAAPVVRLAKALGWQVTVADHRAAYASARHFPEADRVVLVRYERIAEDAPPVDAATPVVVMTHHFLHDLEILAHLLGSPAPYIGLLGPRRRFEKLMEELARRGARPTAAQLARLHAPLGLDVGTETPEEIALSATAEIRAVLAGRPGGFLRDRSEPLHPWPG